MRDIDIARWLTGKDDKSGELVGRTRTYTGVALADSSGGRVVVDLGGDAVTADGQQGIEIACGPQVKEGDKVIVTAVNGSPYVSSVDGWGDYVGAQAAFASLYVGDLTAREITADRIDAATGFFGTLEANQIEAESIIADHGTIANLDTTYATIANLEANYATVQNLESNYAHISNGKIDNATIDAAKVNDLSASVANIADARIASATIEQAQVKNLSADYAHVTNGSIDNAKIGYAKVTGLDAQIATVADAQIASATIEQAQIKNLSSDYAHLTNGKIDNATIDVGRVDNLSANYAHITNGSIDNADIGYAHVTGLDAHTASIAQAEIADATIGYAQINGLDAHTADIADARIANATIGYEQVSDLDAHYASIDLANVSNAWIANGTIKDAAISDGMINSVSANKLTAGTIDASRITVSNLNADNITAGTINGQRIGAGSLSLDKLAEDVYTEGEVDGKLATMQKQIDGAIETWTGTAVPTLNNAPASSWKDAATRDTHVGDVYFVVNSDSQQNGYNYRFTKTGSTYSWQLIKDNDVTQALKRLTDAEGKIGTIEQFDSDISSWKTDTDDELSSMKNAHNTLAGRVSTAEGELAVKVDTTTFNALSQTVDENSSKITTLTETTETALASGVEYVEGTQTASTNAWTGRTRDASLAKGKTIAYKLPYAGTSTAATLNLTLSGGGTSGAKGVYRNNSTVTTQFAAGSVIQMTYDGAYWRVTGMGSDTNTYNRLRYESAIKAAEAVTSGRVICGTSAGYRNLAASASFDLSYPLLYSRAAIAKDATGTNNDLMASNVNYSSNGAVQSGAAPKLLYLKGTVSGTTFTVAASDWLTTAVPTSEDGLHYIPLGVMSSATNGSFSSTSQLWAYFDGKFQQAAPSVIATSNTVNEVKQTADSNYAKITQLVTTVGANADGTNPSTKSVLSRTSAVEQDLGKFKTTVGETYATNDSVSQKVSTLEQTVDGVAATVRAAIDEAVVGENVLTGSAADPNNWTIKAPSGASYAKSAYGTAGTKVTFATVGGYENLYSPAIPVTAGRSYTLSVDYTVAKAYTLSASTEKAKGYGLGVYATSSYPGDGYDQNKESYLAKAVFSTMPTSGTARASATFAATTDKVVLMLNGGMIADNQSGLAFTIDNVKLVENVSSRLSDAETKISQNADAIELRATRTELERRTNMLLDADASSTAKVNAAWTRYWSDASVTSVKCSMVALADPPAPGVSYAARFVCDGTNTGTVQRGLAFYDAAANVIPLVAGQDYVASWWARCTDGEGRTALHYSAGGGETTLRAGDIEALGGEWRRCYRRFTSGGANTNYTRLWFRANFEKGKAGTVELCGFELHPAVYATGSDLTSAKAEIKITTDGISAEVGKISSAKYVKAQAAGWTLANIKVYAAEGHSENWNVDSTEGVRVGDTVYVSGTDSTRNCPVYIKTTVTSVTSATKFVGTSHGYEDQLPVESVISTINQSAESVKISASKVDIEGAAIFSSGKLAKVVTATQTEWYSSTSATSKAGGSWATTQPSVAAGRYVWQRVKETYSDGTSAYKPSDAGVCIQGQTNLSSYSTTAQMNEAIDNANSATLQNAKEYADAIEVGGRNLLKGTAKAQSKTMPAVAAGSYATWDPYQMIGAYNTLGLTTDDSVTLSFDWSVTGAAAGATAKFGTNNTPFEYFGMLITFAAGASSGHVEKTFKVTSALTACTSSMLRVRIDAVGNAVTTSMALTLSNVKLEKGNRATDWTPAPEDVEASIASVENGLGGFDILWNRASFDSDVNAGGECYLCAYDPTTATRTDANGWAMWNGVKRAVPKGMFNPNAVLPYNIPIYVVCRLSSATAATGTNYMVWYNGSKWRSGPMSPSASNLADWTWAEATDMVLGKFVEPGSEVAFAECETYRQPLKWGAVTTDTVTARSAQATANAAAPKTTAVQQTQRVYYKSSSTTAPTAPSTWVTSTATAASTWTTKRMPYDSSYKYLYTCVQKQTVSGAVSCTAVLLDDTTTVIDGGNIITGTVAANQIASNAVTAAKIASGAVTADKVSAGALSVGHIGDLAVGGRNLLQKSATFEGWNVSNSTKVVIADGVATISNSGATSNVNYQLRQWIGTGRLADYMGKYLCVSVEVMSPDWSALEEGSSTGLTALAMQVQTSTITPPGNLPGSMGRYLFSRLTGAVSASYVKVLVDGQEPGSAALVDGQWARVEIRCLKPVGASFFSNDASKVDGYDGLVFNLMLRRNGTVSFRRPKVEVGTVPTDWTPAPEDVDAQISKLTVDQNGIKSSVTSTAATTLQNAKEYTDGVRVGGRNLLGSTGNTGATIVGNSAASATFGSVGSYNVSASALSFDDYDGYANAVVCANDTGTGNRGAAWYTKPGAVKAGETYTFSCMAWCSAATPVHMHTAWRDGSATATYTGWTATATKPSSVAASTWTPVSLTFTPAASAKLDWEFLVALCFTGVSSGIEWRIAHAKLECGNRATDWTPAPEDIDRFIASAEGRASGIAEKAVSAAAKADGKADAAAQAAKDADGHAGRAETAAGKAQDTADEAVGRVSAVEGTVSGVQSALSAFETTFKQDSESFTASIKALDESMNEIDSWLTFGLKDSKPTMTIGTDGSPIRSEFTNESLNFVTQGGDAVMSLDGASSTVVARNIETSGKVKMGSYEWVPSGDGITLVYVG